MLNHAATKFFSNRPIFQKFQNHQLSSSGIAEQDKGQLSRQDSCSWRVIFLALSEP